MKKGFKLSFSVKEKIWSISYKFLHNIKPIHYFIVLVSVVEVKMNVNCLIDTCLQLFDWQVSSKSMQNSVCTLYELSEGEDSEGTGKCHSLSCTSFILSRGRWTTPLKAWNIPHNMSLGHSLLILSRNVH